jgi:hypothetical protein
VKIAPLLAAPTPAQWLEMHLPRHDGPPGTSVGVADLLAADGALLRTVHARLLDEYGATPTAAAKWLVSWFAGTLAGAVGLALATASAGLLPDARSVRWWRDVQGVPTAVEPGATRVLVAAEHAWAGQPGVEVVRDRAAVARRAVEALVAAVEPVVEACRALARLGRTAAWVEVGDRLGTAVLFVPGLPVTADVVDVLRAAAATPGAPWRQCPYLRVVESALGPVYVGRKAGCCLSYLSTPASDRCSTCSLRDLADCRDRQVIQLEQDAACA